MIIRGTSRLLRFNKEVSVPAGMTLEVPITTTLPSMIELNNKSIIINSGGNGSQVLPPAIVKPIAALPPLHNHNNIHAGGLGKAIKRFKKSLFFFLST